MVRLVRAVGCDCQDRRAPSCALRTAVRSGLSLPYELAARERRGKALSATMAGMTPYRTQYSYGNH
jgi:hypothetical protein